MTTAIKNPVICTHCGHICADAALIEIRTHHGWTDNPENSTPDEFEYQCRRCERRDEFRMAIICAVCDDYPCQCEEQPNEE